MLEIPFPLALLFLLLLNRLSGRPAQSKLDNETMRMATYVGMRLCRLQTCRLTMDRE